MKRKIILNLAMSLDGYIADEDGGFDWIVGHGDKTLDTKNQLDYAEFLKDIDIVVMGKKCFDQDMHNDFKDKKVYVATSQEIENYENINFINGDICKIIEDEKRIPGKDIYLYGGGVVVDSFIKADIIDEYIIGVIPTILGKGRPLFLGNSNIINLRLNECMVSDGVTVMRYSRR